MILGLLLLSALAPAAPAERVFLAPLRAGDDVDATTRQSLEGAVLVAAKRLGVNVIGAGDVQALVDVEVARQAAGCSSDSCAAELADALGAPQLLVGQIAHVGETWVLTLTHLERAELRVLGRGQIAQAGASAAVLLPLAERLTQEMLGVVPATAAGSPLVPAGVVTGAVGAVVGLGGGGLWLYAAGQHGEGLQRLSDGDVAGARKIREDNEPLYWAGVLGVGGGAALAIVGAGLFVGGLLSEEGL